MQLLKKQMYIYSKSNIYAKFVGSFQKFKVIHMQSLQVASRKPNVYMQNKIYVLNLQVASKNFKCIHRQSLWVASKKMKWICMQNQSLQVASKVFTTIQLLENQMYICKIKSMCKICRQLQKISNVYIGKVYGQLLKK